MRSSWAWGLDCGALRLGLGFVEGQRGDVSTTAASWRHMPMDLSDSLLRCHRTCLQVFDQLVSTYPPFTVAFEMPTGRVSNPSLMLHTGVIVLAAREVTGLRPWRCAVSEWKKAVSGKGTMSKADLVPWGEGISLSPLLKSGEPDFDQLAGAAVAAYAAHRIGALDLSKLHAAKWE